jgi:hypothetical protein
MEAYAHIPLFYSTGAAARQETREWLSPAIRVAAFFPQLVANCTQINGNCPRIARLLLLPVSAAASLNTIGNGRLKIKGIYYKSASLAG